jgi:hypothetical protein
MIYLLLASIVAGFMAGWMRGGKPSRLADVTFRLWWIVPILAALQSFTINRLHSASRLRLLHPRPLLLIGTYIVLWVVVWWNRRQPGMWFVLLGVTLNLIAIAANGGYMPIIPEALARIGAGEAAYQMPASSVVRGSKDVLVWIDEARFWMLGDLLVIPEPFPWPTAMSVGDVALAVGVFMFIVQSMQSYRVSGSSSGTQHRG